MKGVEKTLYEVTHIRGIGAVNLYEHGDGSYSGNANGVPPVGKRPNPEIVMEEFKNYAQQNKFGETQ